MINKTELEDILLEYLKKDDLELVEVKVTNNNIIKIYIDALNGVPISKCAEISKFVERKLDRNKEDFELEVSSYDITAPFVLPLHYLKNVGRKVEVLIKGEGNSTQKTIKGILKEVKFTDDGKEISLIEVSETKGKKQEVYFIEESTIKRTRLISII